MIKETVLAVLLLASFAASQDWFHSCTYIPHLNCATFPRKVSCGSDKVTYDNECELSKAHCKDRFIHKLHDGKCGTGVTINATRVHEIVFELFCQHLIGQPCGNEEEIICATDGITYKNLCEYEKAKCTHRILTLERIGPCP